MPDPLTTMVGGTLGSAAIGANSASKAADASVEAANEAARVQREMYQQTREDLAPYRDLGLGSIDDLNRLTSPRATDAQMKRWREKRSGVNDRIDRIQNRIDRREGKGFTRGTSGTSATSTGGFLPDRTGNASTSSDPTSLGATMASDLLDGLGVETFGNDVLDTAFGRTGDGTDGTSTPGDARLNRLYKRLDKATDRKEALTGKIQDGKGGGPALRDPEDYKADPLYSPFDSKNFEKDFRVKRKDGKLADDYEIGDGQFGKKKRFRTDIGEFDDSAYDFKVDESKFKTDPGYEFRRAEGEKALARQAAAGGLAMSGALYKDLAGYNSGLASDEFNRWWGREYQEGMGALQGRTAYDDRDFRANEANYAKRADDWDRMAKSRSMNYSMAEGDWQRDRMDNTFNLGLRQAQADRNFRDANFNYGQKTDAYNRGMQNWRYAVGDAFNKVGIGQSAAAGTAAAGTSSAANQGNALMAGGNAAATGHINTGNALTGGIDNLLGIYGAYKGGYFGDNTGSTWGKW